MITVTTTNTPTIITNSTIMTSTSNNLPTSNNLSSSHSTPAISTLPSTFTSSTLPPTSNVPPYNPSTLHSSSNTATSTMDTSTWPTISTPSALTSNNTPPAHTVSQSTSSYTNTISAPTTIYSSTNTTSNINCTYKSFASMAQKVQSTVDKKNAIILEHAGFHINDYIRAISDIIGPENIVMASKVSSYKTRLFLTSVTLVNHLSYNVGGMKIREVFIKIRPLITPYKKIIISGVKPWTPNEDVQNCLLAHGFNTSCVYFTRNGMITPKFQHILTEKRYAFIDITEKEDFSLPSAIDFMEEGEPSKIYLQFEVVLCGNCKGSHYTSKCPYNLSGQTEISDPLSRRNTIPSERPITIFTDTSDKAPQSNISELLDISSDVSVTNTSLDSVNTIPTDGTVDTGAVHCESPPNQTDDITPSLDNGVNNPNSVNEEFTTVTYKNMRKSQTRQSDNQHPPPKETPKHLSSTKGKGKENPPSQTSVVTRSHGNHGMSKGKFKKNQ